MDNNDNVLWYFDLFWKEAFVKGNWKRPVNNILEENCDILKNVNGQKQFEYSCRKKTLERTQDVMQFSEKCAKPKDVEIKCNKITTKKQMIFWNVFKRFNARWELIW